MTLDCPTCTRKIFREVREGAEASTPRSVDLKVKGGQLWARCPHTGCSAEFPIPFRFDEGLAKDPPKRRRILIRRTGA